MIKSLDAIVADLDYKYGIQWNDGMVEPYRSFEPAHYPVPCTQANGDLAACWTREWNERYVSVKFRKRLNKALGHST